MPATVVFDKDAPGGKVMDLAKDFVEVIECKPEDPIDNFLARHSPLTVHACWVRVRTPPSTNHTKSPNPRTTEIDPGALQRGLVWLSSRGNAVTAADVHRVARNTGYTSGKWKVRVFEDKLEVIWGRIARAVHAGLLQPCTSAKVSTSSTQAIRDRGNEHTIYVYVDNFLDEHSVMELRRSLEKLLVQDTGDETTTSSKTSPAKTSRVTLAQFKPDVFTYMGWGTGTTPPLISAYHTLEPLCAACGNRAQNGKKLKKCTACKEVSYCNVECQRCHWKDHRPQCGKKKKIASEGAKRWSCER